MEIDSRISLVISATVTGFANLFTFDADEKLKRSGVNFEMRNELSFLQPGQTIHTITYAKPVSAAKGVLAYSRVTRILDAFNRSGILVISLLLEQDVTLARKIGGDSEHGIYDFLKEIDAKFCGLHFQRSSLDTDMTALGRNDYSEIMASYEVVPSMTKPFKFAEQSKAIAYVPAIEGDVYKYFANPLRRGFAGYFRLFFGDKSIVPQGSVIINEPADEVKIYDVMFKDRKIKEVDSLDALFGVSDFTPGLRQLSLTVSYNAIKSGVDSRLDAFLTEDSIVITYKPEVAKEKFNGCFVCSDLCTPFDISRLALQIIADNNQCDSSKWSVEDGDLYLLGDLAGRKLEFIDGTNQYKIVPVPSNHLKFCVEPVFRLTLNFPNANKSKTIEFTNRKFNLRLSPESFTSSSMDFALYGKDSDWDFQITSEYYKDVKDSLMYHPDGLIELQAKAPQNVTIFIEGLPKGVQPRYSHTDRDGYSSDGFFNYDNSANRWSAILVIGKKYTIRCSGFKDLEISPRSNQSLTLERNLLGAIINNKKKLVITVLSALILICCTLIVLNIIKRNSEKDYKVYVSVAGSENDLTNINSEEFKIEAAGTSPKLDVNREKAEMSFSIKGKDIPAMELVFADDAIEFGRWQLQKADFEIMEDTLILCNQKQKRDIEEVVKEQSELRKDIHKLYSRYSNNSNIVITADKHLIDDLSSKQMSGQCRKKIDSLKVWCVNRRLESNEGGIKALSESEFKKMKETFEEELLNPKTPRDTIEKIKKLSSNNKSSPIYQLSIYLLECLKGNVVKIDAYMKKKDFTLPGLKTFAAYKSTPGSSVEVINRTFNGPENLNPPKPYENVQSLCDDYKNR